MDPRAGRVRAGARDELGGGAPAHSPEPRARQRAHRALERRGRPQGRLTSFGWGRELSRASRGRPSAEPAHARAATRRRIGLRACALRDRIPSRREDDLERARRRAQKRDLGVRGAARARFGHAFASARPPGARRRRSKATRTKMHASRRMNPPSPPGAHSPSRMYTSMTPCLFARDFRVFSPIACGDACPKVQGIPTLIDERSSFRLGTYARGLLDQPRTKRGEGAL